MNLFGSEKNTIGVRTSRLDYYALCIYLVNFSKNYSFSCDELSFFFWLLRKNRASRLYLKVCAVEILSLINRKKLHLTESGLQHLFGEEGEFCASKFVDSYLSYIENKGENDDEVTFFKEDNAINREVVYGTDCSFFNDSIDFARIQVLAGEDEIRKIMTYTLFAKSGSDGKDFVSLPKKVSIPDRALKIFCDFSQVKVISDFLSLNFKENVFLNMILRYDRFDAFANLTDDIKDNNILDFYATVLGTSVAEINSILRADKPLMFYGIFDKSYDGKIEISEEAKACIQTGTTDPFFASVLKEVKYEPHDLESFSVTKDDREIIQQLLESDQNVNILLYGEPGSGKTEFAKSIIRSVGKKALFFNNDLELLEGGAIRSLNRIAIAGQGSDCVIVVDEADKVLDTVPEESIFGNSANVQKGAVNRMLESSKNQIIWITNKINQIDMSTRRRFIFSLKFDQMSEENLRLITKNTIQDIKMNTNLRNEILNLCCDYKVTGASVENVHKMLKCMDFSSENSERNVKQVRAVLKSNSELLNGSAKIRSRQCKNYCLDALNTSTDAEKIVHMIENAKRFAAKNRTEENGIRILFYGASGTGKTEFARYIAERLHKQILIKRVSDIFSKYVGESEQNVAAAFSEAESSDKILLFDEADSFFTDRNNLQNSWERNVVNEFLTQLEEFKGILICTTNLKQVLDPAIQRRFHLFTEFKPLERNGIEKLLGRYFSSIKFDDSQVLRLARTGSVTPGDFASLSSRIRFMEEDDLNADYVVGELLKIQKDKEDSGSENKIGFAG